MKKNNSRLLDWFDWLEFELHKNFTSIDNTLIGFPERVQVLEDLGNLINQNSHNTGISSESLGEIIKRCTILENKVIAMRTSKEKNT